jgi:hypothetical protein
MRSAWFPAVVMFAAVPPASAQSIEGRVLDAATRAPVADVRLHLLNQAGTRVAAATTDSTGSFSIVGRGAGRYSLQLSHIAYAPWTSPPIPLAYMETVTLEIPISTAALRQDPIVVTARRRSAYHDISYDGLYARMQALPPVGSNRIVMKGDVEIRSTMQIREILERFFYPVWRKGNLCYYWNGFPVNPRWAALRLTNSVEVIEAVEVYGDYLMAPMEFRADLFSPHRPSCTTGVVAMWALRPDLPGRPPQP